MVHLCTECLSVLSKHTVLRFVKQKLYCLVFFQCLAPWFIFATLLDIEVTVEVGILHNQAQTVIHAKQSTNTIFFFLQFILLCYYFFQIIVLLQACIIQLIHVSVPKAFDPTFIRTP